MTPPAKEALRISSISKRPLLSCMIELAMKAPTQDVQSASTVLTTTLCYALPTARAPLKDGQYIHRKIHPITPNMFEV